MKIIEFLLSALAIGVTFLYGSTGEIITEKAGHLNLGIPGIMGIGAACGCAALSVMIPAGADPLLPAWLIVILALLATLIGGALMGLLYSFLAVTLRSNQNVTGLAMTIFGTGLTKYIFNALEKKDAAYLRALPFFRFPFNNTSSALQYCGILVFIGIGVAIAASIILTRTRVGLHLRAVGESPATADAAGINVVLYKYLATSIGCGICGLGGVFYVMDWTFGTWANDGAIEGLGWLAVALVIFALWKPINAILGSYLFGILSTVYMYISTSRSSQELFKMLPYLVTIVVLIVISLRKKREYQAPESLGIPYFREDR